MIQSNSKKQSVELMILGVQIADFWGGKMLTRVALFFDGITGLT